MMVDVLIADQKSQVEYTFDNPKHPHARWGRIISSDNQSNPMRVRLEYIGTGYPHEIKGCRQYQR